HPQRATYTVPAVVGLTGVLDQVALEQALTALAARHEPLRTRVRDTGSGPIAQVGEPAPVPLESAGPAVDPWPLVDAFLQLPFALDAEPPLRALLISLAPEGRAEEGIADRHLLVLAVHHIATDGDSQRILLAELGELYSGRALAPLPVAYGDVVLWRAGRPTDVSGRLHALRGHRDRPLALEGPDPAAAQGIGARHTRSLGPQLTAAVRACADARRTTVFTALLAAFADVVARWSGSDDVCLGYPLSVREPDAARDLVGFFVETCAVRIDVSGRPSYGGVVDRVHAEVVAASTAAGHFEELAEAVAGERGDRRPLFRAWFNHLGGPTPPPQLAGLTARLLPPPSPPALFDLNMYVVESVDDIHLELVRDVAACSPEAAEEILRQYTALLAHAVADPDAPLRYRPPSPALPDPAEPLNPGEPLPPAAAPAFARQLARTARHRASTPAVDGLSYAALRTAVRELTAAIRAARIPPGATVAVAAERNPDLVVAMLGVWAAQCRLLVLDPDHPPPRNAAACAAAQADCLIAAEFPV
ncbi:condensation domain-containing protein, partial [Lysinibacillus sp. NPDC056185]|uniref:condensation domain-containing protein n=1 Tax=Lysinibacillus sp. NPDC056185 TaxID=3345739 RepID=UPI0039F1258F